MGSTKKSSSKPKTKTSARAKTTRKPASKSKKLKLTKKSRFSKKIALVFAVVFAAIGTFALLQSDAATPRDTFQRPFSSYSPWNMPIHKDATYVKAGWQGPNGVTQEKTWLFKATNSDPEVNVYRPFQWRDRCNPSSTGYEGKLRTPEFRVPDISGNSTPNDNSAIVQPDGSVSYIAVTCRESSSPIYGYLRNNAHTVSGDGIVGSHGASQMSPLGGSIRPGELTNDEPIRHALSLVLWTKYAYSSKQGSYTDPNSRCFRWPASSCDSYHARQDSSGNWRYGGSDPRLTMGSLMALPKNLSHQDLNINSKEARKVFDALQTYGGYFIDDSAWDHAYISVDQTAPEYNRIREIDSQTKEFSRILDSLMVIDSNSPSSIGGGPNSQVGTQYRLADQLEPLANEWRPVGASSATPVSSPAPAPTPAPTPTPDVTGGEEYILRAPNSTTGQSVRASSQASGTFTPQKAVDGDESASESRWISSSQDNQWIEIDLGETKNVNRLAILWAGDTTKDFDVQLSTDGQNFSTIRSGSTNNEQFFLSEHELNNTPARYVRVLGKTRWNSSYGNSIREMLVYLGPESVAQDSPATGSGSSGSSSSSGGSSGSGSDPAPAVTTTYSAPTSGVQISSSSDKGSVTAKPATENQTAGSSEATVTGEIAVKPKVQQKPVASVSLKIDEDVVYRSSGSEIDLDEVKFDTTGLENGDYALTIETTYEDGETETSTIGITVENDLNAYQKARNKFYTALVGSISPKTMDRITIGTTGVISLSAIGFIVFKFGLKEHISRSLLMRRLRS